MRGYEVSRNIPNIKNWSANIYNKTLYIFGGADKDETASNKIYAFDLESNRWKSLKPKPNSNFNDIFENYC